MNNEEIVLEFRKNHNLRKLIEKNISSSRYHNSKDLEQYIYMEMLLKPNATLEFYRAQGKLVNFVVKMILNQRNYKSSYYNRKIRVADNENYEFFDIGYDVTDVEERLEMEELEMRKWNLLRDFFKNEVFTGTTLEEQEKFVAVSFYGLKLGVEIVSGELILIKPMTMKEIAMNFVDDKVNHNKLKSKTYLVKNYITLGKKLLLDEFKIKKYI